MNSTVKKFENPSISAKVIGKSIEVPFFDSQRICPTVHGFRNRRVSSYVKLFRLKYRQSLSNGWDASWKTARVHLRFCGCLHWKWLNAIELSVMNWCIIKSDYNGIGPNKVVSPRDAIRRARNCQFAMVCRLSVRLSVCLQRWWLV